MTFFDSEKPCPICQRLQNGPPERTPSAKADLAAQFERILTLEHQNARLIEALLPFGRAFAGISLLNGSATLASFSDYQKAYNTLVALKVALELS